MHNGRGVRVLPVHEAVVLVQQGHLAAQAQHGLGQFAADGAAAHDQEAPGTLGQGKNRLVGEKARLGQPGDVRPHGPAAGGDDRFFETQGLAVHVDGVAPGEAGLPQEDVHPQVPEAPGGVMRLIPARRRRMRAITAGKSAAAPAGTCTPRASARRISAHRRAERIRALLGTQP